MDRRSEPALVEPEIEIAAKDSHAKLICQSNQAVPGLEQDDSVLIKIVGNGQNASIEIDGRDADLLYNWLEQHKPESQPGDLPMSQEVPITNVKETSSMSSGKCAGGYDEEFKKLQEMDKEDVEFYKQFDEPDIFTSAPPPVPGTRKAGKALTPDELKKKYPNPGVKMTTLREEDLAQIIEEVINEMGNPWAIANAQWKKSGHEGRAPEDWVMAVKKSIGYKK